MRVWTPLADSGHKDSSADNMVSLFDALSQTVQESEDFESIRLDHGVKQQNTYLIVDAKLTKAFIKLLCQVVTRMAFLQANLQYVVNMSEEY